jgi:O-antigen/teichoic acid export membrane protein
MFALTVPFSALTTIWLSTVQAFQRVDYRVYLERICIPLGTMALVALFLFLGWRWWGVTIGTLLAALVGALCAYYIYRHLRRSLGTIEKERPKLELREWFGFCSPLLLSGVLAFIIARMATLLLGYFRDSFEVGIYDIAAKVAFMVELPLAVSNVVFAPLIGEIYTQGDLDKLQTLFKIVTKWVFTASLLIFLVAVFLANPVLKIFGPEFTAGISVLFILGFSQLINSGTGAVGWVLIMSGHSMLHLFNSALSALLTIILGFLLMPSYGMIGAAITVGSVYILVNMARLAQVFYLLRIHPYRWDFAKPVTAGLLTFGFVYLLQRHVIDSIPPMFWMHAITLGAIVMLYTALLVLLKLRPEEKELLSWAFQKIGVN